MATSLECDINGEGTVENGITLDNVLLLGSKSSSSGQNGYSQFGELHRFSAGISWDATIGVMAHERGHAYFDLPDLYDTRLEPISAGIGAF